MSVSTTARAAGDYLAGHLSAYRSLADLGLLAIVPAGSGGPADRYGDDSASTALALEGLAQSGAATNSNRTIQTGINYLQQAQVNDGSIATSDRTDASSSGDVAATAFTIQALAALHHPTLRTSTGTSVLAGLPSYQQMSSGGLSPFGAYETGVAPSVTQTAEAYPAFDGISFPLPYVAPLPQPPKHTTSTAAAPARASAGTASTGISNTSQGPKKSVGAYRGGTAAGSVTAKTGRRAARPGSQVSGAVVGANSAPKLTTRAGRAPAKDLTALSCGSSGGSIGPGSLSVRGLPSV